MAEWTAEWTGSWPALCHGRWELYKDGNRFYTKIPFQESDAGTYGEYIPYYVLNDWDSPLDHESWWKGMHCDEWCRTYEDWLAKIAPPEEWPSIFAAFQAQDFRSFTCGGCD